MGATGWSYFVPYEVDISAALQRLREQVFARGDYEFDAAGGLSQKELEGLIEGVRPELGPWVQKCRELAADMPEPLKTIYIQNAEKMQKDLLESANKPRKQKRKPKTIEAALEAQAESGTHSILDISHVATEPEFGAVSPLPRSELAGLFESETPSHAQIEEAYDSGSLENHLPDRWQGIYMIVYQDGVPNEIFFAGHSGD